MNSEFFIAKRIYYNNEGEKIISSPALRIAVISIALGLIIMILAVGIVIGFKKEVRNKVVGFGSHIQITNFNSNTLYENYPIAIDEYVLEKLRENSNIHHIQSFINKPAIIKTDSDFQGVVLKGVDENFDWVFFKENLVEGEILNITPDSLSTQVIISKSILDKLNLSLGESFICYFIQEPVRARKFQIAGVYQSNFSEYDQLFILSDIKQLRRLNNWDNDMVSGLELLLYNYEELDNTLEEVYFEFNTYTDRLDNHFYSRSIKQINPMIFAWLDVLDTNVVVILILMLIVSGFSMISGLLIIILEKANMIGILKALGQSNNGIRKIFLYISTFLIIKGLAWGNVIALTIYFIQKNLGILKLDPETYYVAVVPFELNVLSLILINIGTLIVTLLLLLGPSYLVSKISPAETIRFE